MAFIITRDRWRRQPTWPVELDPKWRIFGVMSPIFPAIPYTSGVGSATITVGAGGRGFQTVNAGSGQYGYWKNSFGIPDKFAGATNLSALVFRKVGTVSTAVPFASETSGSWWRYCLCNNGTTFRTRDTSTGDTGTSNDLTLTAGTAGADEVRVLTYSSTRAYKAGYLNGRLDASTTTSVDALNSTASSFIGISTPDTSGAYSNDAPIYLVAFAEREWTAGEAQALGENPWLIFKEKITRIYVGATAGGGAQTLTPSLVTNTSTFYGPTVTRGAVTLTPGLTTNSQTFYAPTVVRGSVTLTPSLVTNAQTFYAATVSVGATTLLPSLVTNAQTFYAATVSVGAVTLAPSLLTNEQTFYGPVVSSGGLGLYPSLVTNAQTFYAATISTGAVTIQPGLFGNGQTFYGPTVSATYTLAAPLLTNAQTFFSPEITQGAAQIIVPLVTNTQTFYSPTVTGGTTGLTLEQKCDLLLKLMLNKQVTDPATGLMTIYDDDDTTVLYQGNVYEDAAGTTLYRGQGIERRERLQPTN